MRVSPWIFVGVGLGGLLVVVALGTLGRRRQPEADPEALADAALQTIEAHAAEHPDDLGGLIVRYEALRSQHPGTQAAEVAAERIRQLQDAQREIAKPPPPPPRPPKPDREAPALAALRAIEAYAATHPDDLDDLIARYQALRSQHRGTQAAEVAAERIRQLEEARQEAAKPPAQPDREAEERAFAALRTIESHAAKSPDDLDDLIARYDAPGPVVQADEQAVALIQAFWPAVEKGLRRAIGVRLAIGPGAVKAVGNGHVTFEDKGKEVTRRVDQLDGTLAINLARLGDSMPGILTRVVVYLAERKELHRVEALLDKARAHPTVPAYRRRLAALRQAERARRK